MSRIRANTIVDSAATGAPTFPNGAIINGISTITADVSASTILVGTGVTITNPANNELQIDTRGNERIRVDGLGNIGIGSDSPTDVLDILTGSSDEVTSLKVKDQGRIEISRNHANAPYIRTSMSSGQPSITLGRTGLSQDLVISADNGISMPSGKGIDFSFATGGSGTSTSAVLDDYEEGTWTPSAYLSYNPSGTKSVVSANQSGTYTKIGKLVTVWFQFNYTLSGTGSYNMGVTNLPFAANNAFAPVGGGARESASTGNFYQCEGVQNTNISVLRRYDNAGAYDGSGQMSGFCTYRIA